MNLAIAQMMKYLVWNPHKLTEDTTTCTTASIAERSYTNSKLSVDSQVNAKFPKRLARRGQRNVPFVKKNILYDRNVTKSVNFKNTYSMNTYVPIICFGDMSGNQALLSKIIHVYSHLEGYNFITAYVKEDSFWKAGMTFL